MSNMAATDFDHHVLDELENDQRALLDFHGTPWKFSEVNDQLLKWSREKKEGTKLGTAEKV